MKSGLLCVVKANNQILDENLFRATKCQLRCELTCAIGLSRSPKSMNPVFWLKEICLKNRDKNGFFSRSLRLET